MSGKSGRNDFFAVGFLFSDSLLGVFAARQSIIYEALNLTSTCIFPSWEFLIQAYSEGTLLIKKLQQ